MIPDLNRFSNQILRAALALVLMHSTAQAQAPGIQTEAAAPKSSQLSLDIGALQGTLSFAWSVPERGFGYGLGADFSWEDVSLLIDKNIWDVLHGEFFARYHPSTWMHLDMGATLMRYAPFDDTNKRGTFVGGYLALMFGRRWIFLGSQAAAGIANDLKGSDFAIAWRPLALRLMLRF